VGLDNYDAINISEKVITNPTKKQKSKKTIV
jgi:hypothetical protein